MTNKVTLTDRINAITFETLTEEDFQFLVERALKSVRPAGKRSDKPTKAQVARQAELEKVVAFVAEKGAVTCADVEAEFGISNQKAARALKDAPGVVKATEAKGKTKATWVLAQ
jgi:predicted HTH transcriptional regulator